MGSNCTPKRMSHICTGTTLPVQKSRQIQGISGQPIHLLHKSLLKIHDNIGSKQHLGTSHSYRMSGGWQETVTRESWFKRRYRTWREGQRSRLPKEPGPIGTLPKAIPLGGSCGDWSHSTCPPSWDQCSTHSQLQQTHTSGKEGGPVVQVSWAHILSGFKQNSPRKVQVAPWQSAHGTCWQLGAGEIEKTPANSENNITPVCKGRGKATTATRTRLLQKTQSWDMKVNPRGGLQFPQVVQTTSRLHPLLAYSPLGR